MVKYFYIFLRIFALFYSTKEESEDIKQLSAILRREHDPISVGLMIANVMLLFIMLSEWMSSKLGILYNEKTPFDCPITSKWPWILLSKKEPKSC